MSAPQRVLPIDPACRPYVIVSALVAAIGFVLAIDWLWIVALIFLFMFLGFFRDPARPIPETPGVFVSPADGTVAQIHTTEDPAAGPVGVICVTIFLSVFDVHVNRSPCAGVVESIRHRPGLKLNAINPDSNNLNESTWIVIRDGERRVTVRQIAGLIARRIVCRLKPGQRVQRGQRIGVIKFSSRTQIYLPPEALIQVRRKQKVRGGMDVIAVLPDAGGES